MDKTTDSQNHKARSMTDNTKKHYDNGILCYLMDNYQEAIAEYTRAIELTPDYADAYFRRGTVHLKIGNDKEGTADLVKANSLRKNRNTE